MGERKEVLFSVTIFYSYSHEDEKWQKQLEIHLKNLQRQGFIKNWHDRNISAGRIWASEIDVHLNTADIILLLISPDFIASEYCYSIEAKRAIERLEIGEARVIPIILRPTDWKGTPFEKLQVLPTDAKPITNWSNHDDAFLDIVRGVRTAVEELQVQRSDARMHPNGIQGHEAEISLSSPLWTVPYRRNPFFTGREVLLTYLRDQLTNNKIAMLTQSQAISGLGGVGKTQTALEYAYRHKDRYHAVLWINATTVESLRSDFVQLASRLHISEQETQDQDTAINAVKNWLSRQRDWLLIFDNADDIEIVRDFLPLGRDINGHILLTTRATAMGNVANNVEMEKMEQQEGILLLLRRTRLLALDAPLDHMTEADRTVAETIVKVLDALPLALDQAGAYIEETGCSLSEYLKLYQNRRRDLLGRRSSLSVDYSETVLTTWSLAFRKIEQKNRAAADMLRLCAFLAPDAIPEEIIEKGALYLSRPLRTVAIDAFALNEAMQEVLRYSLMRRNAQEKTFNMHALVQVVLKDTMSKKVQRLWAERAVQVVSHAFPSEIELATWPVCQRLLPHAQMCANIVDQYGFAFAEAAQLLHQTGYYLHEQTLYEEAKRLYEQALRIKEVLVELGQLSIATTLYELARLYQDQGQYGQAEPLYQRALAIREEMLGPIHPSVATTLYELAQLYQNQGQYGQAEPLYQRALAIREEMLGPIHPSTATLLYALARLYQNQDQYEQAEPLYQRAFAISEQGEGSQQPETATTLKELAMLHQAQGQYEQAELLYQRALAIKERVLGPKHPSTVATLHLLALLHQDQGQIEQAELLYQRVYAIREEVLGPRHPSTAATLHQLAILYQSQGRYLQAERLYQRVLDIEEKALGPYHPSIAITRGNYARLLKEMEQKREATNPSMGTYEGQDSS